MKLCARKTTASPQAEEMPVSSSNSLNLELALHHIMDDAHNIIGIWGMGGIGKTHLLKQIYNKNSKDSTFSLVLFVTCSKECTEEKVQNEIIDKLGLNKHYSMEGKRITIFDFLKQKSFVLLLDDLWSRLNLETVGIPTPYDIVGNCKRKVVLTTRSEKVCNLMKVDKKMKLYVLEWNEAWSLFKGKVSEQTIESHPLILMYAVNVVKELGGLPLALITVGRAMHDKTDLSEWKHAAELLKQARLHDVELSGREEPVFEVLKFSIDKLGSNNLRACLLHCSLWPEDHPIEKNELVELWMGLGLINENDIHMAYNVGYDNISSLQSACLLESTDSDSQVKLHDVIRDMSLWIISNKGVDQNKWIVRSRASNQSRVDIKSETEKISLMYHHVDRFSFDPSFWDMTCRLTTFLFTWSNLYNVSVLGSQSFSCLTVLNLKGNKITVFPTEICRLPNLQFVDLSDNKIKSLPDEIGALVNLNYLCLKGNLICTIAAGAIAKMRALKVLDLSPSCHHLKKKKRDKLDCVRQLLEELRSIQEFGALGIEFHNEKEMQILKDYYVPVRWLTITTWQRDNFSLREVSEIYSYQLRKLFSLSITNMEVLWVIFQSRYPNRLEQLYIYKVGMRAICWRHLADPKRLLPFLKCITISMCDRLENISWVVHLPCLQELTVSVCQSMKQLIHGYKLCEPIFPLLKLLVLEELPQLKTIGDPEIVFPALQTFKIFRCYSLRNFPFSAVKIPPKLNHIWVEEEWWKVKWSQDSLTSSLIEYVRFLY